MRNLKNKLPVFSSVLFLLGISSTVFADNTVQLKKKINLTQSKIVIPLIDENNNNEIETSLCHINLPNKGTSTIKKITSQYISNPELLEKHISHCYALAKKDPCDPFAKDKSRWTVNFKFGFSRTNYNNTDIKVDGPELQGTMYDFNFAERTSSRYYNPQNWEKLQNAFQWIDEPTNHFVLTIEKGKHNIIISMFHPKWTMGNNHYIRVAGKINGVEKDQYMDIDEPFEEDYSNFSTQPGELKLIIFENTHMQMEYSLGYGHDFTLFSTKKLGELKFQPAIYAGIMSGINKVVTRDHNNYWAFTGYSTKNQIQGPMVAAGAHIEWDFGLVDVFYQFKYTHAWMKEPGFGGTIEYQHSYTTNTFGLGIDLFSQKNRAKKKRKKRDW